MKKRIVCALILPVAITAAYATETPPEALSSNVVARIDGFEIPAEWFDAEFRANVFKHMNADDPRGEIFNPFLNRMILRAQAVREGVGDDPEVRQEITRRIEGMRAYMEYQLAMTEIGMLNGALVEKLELETSPSEVTDEEVEAFLKATVSGRPGIPESLHDLPPEAVSSIRQQIASRKTMEKLDAMIAEWRKSMDITINEQAVQAAPMPEIKGAPPR